MTTFLTNIGSVIEFAFTRWQVPGHRKNLDGGITVFGAHECSTAPTPAIEEPCLRRTGRPKPPPNQA